MALALSRQDTAAHAAHYAVAAAHGSVSRCDRSSVYDDDDGLTITAHGDLDKAVMDTYGKIKAAPGQVTRRVVLSATRKVREVIDVPSTEIAFGSGASYDHIS
jgi:hypothetical protein